MTTLHEHLNRYFPHINKELKEFYASIAIRGFAVYLVTIFEPIYVYINLGYSLPKTFLYFGVISLVFGLLSPFTARLTVRYGSKHTMLISIPFLFVYYVGLWNIEHLGFFVIFLPLLSALDRALFWPAYHIAFTRLTDKGRRGQEVSLRTMILSAVAAVAPFAGGFMIQHFGGFALLFAVVLALLFASSVPLLISKDVHEKSRHSFLQPFKQIFSRKYRRKAVAFASSAGDLALEEYVWPIFLFTLAINFETLGLIISATLLFGMVFTFYIGRKSDAVGHGRVLAVGSFLDAVIWPFKIFVLTPLNAFLSDVLHRFARTSSYIPFGALFYEWVGEDEKERDKLVIFREVVLNVTRGVFLFFLAILFTLNIPLNYMFALGPLFALGLLFMIDKPKKFIHDVAEDVEPM
ncbi:MAG: MFS transporter [Candidatus Spechtbacterales bacterium]